MAGKKKGGSKKVDPSMYASRSVPKVSAAEEAALRDAVATAAAAAAAAAAGPSTSVAARAADAAAVSLLEERRVQRVVSRLLLDGFDSETILSAVRPAVAAWVTQKEASGGGSGGVVLPTEEELDSLLLDHLCLTLPEDALPASFRTAHNTVGEDADGNPLMEMVRHSRREGGKADEAAAAAAAAEEEEEARARAEAVLRATEERQVRQRAQAEEERRRALEFIVASAAAREEAEERCSDDSGCSSESSDGLACAYLSAPSARDKKRAEQQRKAEKGGGAGAQQQKQAQKQKGRHTRHGDDEEEEDVDGAAAQQPVPTHISDVVACPDWVLAALTDGADDAASAGVPASERAAFGSSVQGVYAKDKQRIKEAGPGGKKVLAARLKVLSDAFKAVLGAKPEQWKPEAETDDAEDDEGCAGLFDDDAPAADDDAAGSAHGLLGELANATLTRLRAPPADLVPALCTHLGLRGGAAANVGRHAPKGLLQRFCAATGCSPPLFRSAQSGGGGGFSVVVTVGKTKTSFVFGEERGSAAAVATAVEGHNHAAVAALFELALPSDDAANVYYKHVSPGNDKQLFDSMRAVYALFDSEGEEAAPANGTGGGGGGGVWQSEYLRLLRRHVLSGQNVAFAKTVAAEVAAAAADAQPAAAAAASAAAATSAKAARAGSGARRPTRLPAAVDASLTESERAESARMLKECREHVWSEAAPHAELLRARAALPAARLRAQLRAFLSSATEDFCVVAGDTGCGKTTQVPQFVLDHMIDEGLGGRTGVVCTQPRRIAAVSVAERVGAERGGGAAARVGHSVRFDSTVSRETKLTFCTTGILVRRLASVDDPLLAAVTHVILDEVHERSILSDFVMAQVKHVALARRTRGLVPLKVILMSATIDTTLYSSYCLGCPVLEVEGRTFPVEERYLEDVYDETGYELDVDGSRASARRLAGLRRQRQQRDAESAEADRADQEAEDWEAAPPNPSVSAADLRGGGRYGARAANTRRNLAFLDEESVDYDAIAALVDHVDAAQRKGDLPRGGILVFLPGLYDITTVQGMVEAAASASPRVVVALHSTVSADEQRKAFSSVGPSTLKVVLATNIAETSITVPDIKYVVDAGRAKQMAVDATSGITRLAEQWVSKASAKQRKGRAGRVSEGVCYRMYTRARFAKLDAFEEPEVKRLPLTEVCLQAKVIAEDVPRSLPGCAGGGEGEAAMATSAGVLGSLIEPPPAASVERAEQVLEDVGASGPGAQGRRLTVLGRHLAALPLDPRLGKLLLVGAMLGAFAPCLTIAAVLSHKSPFAREGEAAAKVRLAQTGTLSDHLAWVAAYDRWVAAAAVSNKAAATFCKAHGLDAQVLRTLRDTRGQLAGCVADSGMLDGVAGSSGAGAGAGAGRTRRRTTGRDADDAEAPWNRNARFSDAVRAALCAAVQPNVARVVAAAADASSSSVSLAFDGTTLGVHNTSVLAQGPNAAAMRRASYVAFHGTIHSGRRPVATDCTVLPFTALLLFSRCVEVRHRERGAMVDGWLWVPAPARLAVLATRLRGSVGEYFARLLESRKPSSREQAGGGGGGAAGTGEDLAGRLIDPVVRFLASETMQ